MTRTSVRGAWLGKAVAVMLFLIKASAGAEVPDNGWIVFASNRNNGQHDIYFMEANGSGVNRLTTTGARMPTWSPDGRWIVYETVPLGRARVMRWDGSEDKQIFGGKPLFWKHDNSGVVCRDGDDFYLVDPDAETSTLIFRKSDFAQLAGKELNPGGLTHDDRFLLAHSDRYRNGYGGGADDNGFFNAHHAAIILDFQNPSKIWFFGSGCEPTTPPDSSYVYHVCGGGVCQSSKPDVYRMNIGDRDSRSSYSPVIANGDSNYGHEYFPRISTDGQWLTYAASTGCHDHDTCDYDIFVHRLAGSGGNRQQVTSNGAVNDQWPHMYVGDLWGTEPAELTNIEVVAAVTQITPGQSTQISAYPKDQRDHAFAAQLSWSVSGGGSVAPNSSGGDVTEHSTTFTSNGNLGTFTVTASSGGIEGSTTLRVTSVPLLHKKINCGSNDWDVADWERDDAYISGGSDWVNDNSVDVSGVANAAPANVYKSVRHTSPHSYSVAVPDGTYLLRLHFADAFDQRSMNYSAEGEVILQNFDITSQVGRNKALVRDFTVVVSDGNGLQLQATSSGDVFEAGIEIITVATDAGVVDDSAVVSSDSAAPPFDGGTADSVVDAAVADRWVAPSDGGQGDLMLLDTHLIEDVRLDYDAQKSNDHKAQPVNGCNCQASMAAIAVPAFWALALGLLRRREKKAPRRFADQDRS